MLAHRIVRLAREPRFIAFLTMLALLVLANPAMAQAEEGQSNVSVWKMFFFDTEWGFIGIAIVWTLLLLSALCMGFGLNLMMKYRRSMVLPEDTYNQVQQMLEAKQYREAIDYVEGDESYLGKLLSGALNEASNGYSAMERAVEETGDVETTRYLRPVEYLNVVGNIAPMMGLFGTVYGMIAAFQSLVEAGGRPDPVQLAGGISSALVTTFWGLVVAIPTLAAYAVIRNRIDALTSEGLLQAEELISPFKPSGKKRSASASSSSSSSSRPAASAPGVAPTDRPRAVPRPQ